eukprot:3760587-Pleurochrysis_carterae.AAC.1
MCGSEETRSGTTGRWTAARKKQREKSNAGKPTRVPGKRHATLQKEKFHTDRGKQAEARQALATSLQLGYAGLTSITRH